MKLKKGLLVAIIALVLCILASCTPSNSKVYTVGDTYELISNDGTKIGAIKLDSVDYSVNENSDTCNLGLTYIIYPETKMHLDSQNIFVSCETEKYSTDNQKNIDKNGRDIFNLSIEEEIKSLFITAYNTALVDRETLIEDTAQIKNLLTNTEAEEKEITKLEAELAIIAETANKMVKENSVKVQDQDEYQRKYDELTKRYEQTKTKLNKAVLEKSRKESQLLRLDCFLAHLKDCPYIIEEWNEELWNVLLESATVQRDKSITFKFKNGKEINITNLTAK